jgi:hypothetical protein
MFKIRTEQIDAITRVQDAEYHRRLAHYYRLRVPRLVKRLSDEELERRIAKSVKSARAYGVRSDLGIMRYVGLALAAGPSFDQDPAVHRFMTNPGTDPDSKVRWLLERVGNDLKALGG